MKANKLQNPTNKTEFKPDKDLYAVFKQDTVNMSEVSQSIHLLQLTRLGLGSTESTLRAKTEGSCSKESETHQERCNVSSTAKCYR